MLKIDVWNCDVRGLAVWRRLTRGFEQPDYLDDSAALLTDPAVYDAAVDAVYAQGGALNVSGWYDASAALLEAIEQARDRAAR